MFKYSVVVKWSDEDGGFIATVPELEGLSAFGETHDDAVKELMFAAEAYMLTLRESGQEIPTPEKIVPYSGQLRLRLPKSLHGKLAAEAESDGVSLNTYLVSLLARRQGERDTVDSFVKHILEAFRMAVQAPYKIDSDQDSSRYNATETLKEEAGSPNLLLIVGGKS